MRLVATDYFAIQVSESFQQLEYQNILKLSHRTAWSPSMFLDTQRICQDVSTSWFKVAFAATSNRPSDDGFEVCAVPSSTKDVIYEFELVASVLLPFDHRCHLQKQQMEKWLTVLGWLIHGSFRAMISQSCHTIPLTDRSQPDEKNPKDEGEHTEEALSGWMDGSYQQFTLRNIQNPKWGNRLTILATLIRIRELCLLKPF